jgi:hypothetical protein
LEIPEFSKFLHSIKTFPNQRCCVPKVFWAKTATKMACSQPFQCLESGFISPNAGRRDLNGSVKLFEIKETSFQKLMCYIWFSSKISRISKACHAVAFHFATGHSGTANSFFCPNGRLPWFPIGIPIGNFRKGPRPL